MSKLCKIISRDVRKELAKQMYMCANLTNLCGLPVDVLCQSVLVLKNYVLPIEKQATLSVASPAPPPPSASGTSLNSWTCTAETQWTGRALQDSLVGDPGLSSLVQGVVEVSRNSLLPTHSLGVHLELMKAQGSRHAPAGTKLHHSCAHPHSQTGNNHFLWEASPDSKQQSHFPSSVFLTSCISTTFACCLRLYVSWGKNWKAQLELKQCL